MFKNQIKNTNHNTTTQTKHHKIPKSPKRNQKTPDEYLLFRMYRNDFGV